jgi:hypothetical protein
MQQHRHRMGQHFANQAMLQRPHVVDTHPLPGNTFGQMGAPSLPQRVQALTNGAGDREGCIVVVRGVTTLTPRAWARGCWRASFRKPWSAGASPRQPATSLSTWFRNADGDLIQSRTLGSPYVYR